MKELLDFIKGASNGGQSGVGVKVTRILTEDELKELALFIDGVNELRNSFDSISSDVESLKDELSDLDSIQGDISQSISDAQDNLNDLDSYASDMSDKIENAVNQAESIESSLSELNDILEQIED